MRIEEEYDGYSAYNDQNEKVLSVSGYITEEIINKYEGEEEVYTIYAINFYDKGKTQEQTALKEIFKHIQNEFGRYPGIDNHFSSLDGEESELIGSLVADGYIPKQLLLNTEEAMSSPNLSDKKVIKNLIESTSYSRTGFSQSGFLPHNSTLKEREPRSFTKERLPQLLRQIATQLYHFCCSHSLEPTEIQIMYFNSSLFISANSKDAVSAMSKLLSAPSSFMNALITAYDYEGASPVDKRISARHAKKLLTRLYGKFDCNDSRFLDVKSIIGGFTSTFLTESQKFTSFKEGRNIYFVCNKLKSDRHAEENLMDIVENFPLEIIDAKLKPAIFGKKRPCFTCHARLNAESKKITEEFSLRYKPFDFNPNKGLLFKETAYKQAKHALSATETSVTLGSYSDVIYTSKIGGSGYATVSDSDTTEEEEEVSLSVSKLSLKS